MLPMKELAALFESNGADQVKTYIQSGNVLFTYDRDASALAGKLEGQIKERFGVSSPIILRSAGELTAALSNPYLKKGAPESELFLVFLRDEPTEEAASQLDPNRCPPDSFALVGRNLYLHLPNGAANTKFTSAYIDSKLKTVGTARNWRTVNALCEMATTKSTRRECPE